jgi:hypothetical protein
MSDNKDNQEETYSGIYSDNWEPEETTKFTEEELTKRKKFDADMITKSTQLICPKCTGKSYIKDGKCARCDHNLI